MFPVTGKFKGFKLKLYPFASFYLKLAGKTAVFSPKFQVLTDFFKSSNLAVETAIFP
jgi:hypothetical protein